LQLLLNYSYERLPLRVPELDRLDTDKILALRLLNWRKYLDGCRKPIQGVRTRVAVAGRIVIERRRVSRAGIGYLSGIAGASLSEVASHYWRQSVPVVLPIAAETPAEVSARRRWNSCWG